MLYFPHHASSSRSRLPETVCIWQKRDQNACSPSLPAIPRSAVCHTVSVTLVRFLTFSAFYVACRCPSFSSPVLLCHTSLFLCFFGPQVTTVHTLPLIWYFFQSIFCFLSVWVCFCFFCSVLLLLSHRLSFNSLCISFYFLFSKPPVDPLSSVSSFIPA